VAMDKLLIFSDGASRGNPGAAGIGVVISSANGKTVKELSENIGETTNNVAEYTALIRGLEEAVKLRAAEVEIHTDSELMARQITGVYKVKAQHLIPLVTRVHSLLRQFSRVSISHVVREHNRTADALARKGSNARVDR
jgi:ribonuclease HI